MSELARRECVPCQGGDPPLAEAEVNELLPQVPEWQLIEVEGVRRLQRRFKFEGYPEAVAFTVRLALLAQEVDHHPRIVTEWGKVEVQWWTHKIRGLHMNDFVMAARTDEAYE